MVRAYLSHLNFISKQENILSLVKFIDIADAFAKVVQVTSVRTMLQTPLYRNPVMALFFIEA